MPVITHDILLEGVRREAALEWLSDLTHYRDLFDGAFDDVKETGPGQFELTVDVPPKKRVVGVRFKEVDTAHEGRRIIFDTTGKRTTGVLHFSLKTMRPSTNTLVTLHTDYDPGGPLGQVIDAAGLRKRLETAWRKVVENLSRDMPRIAADEKAPAKKT